LLPLEERRIGRKSIAEGVKFVLSGRGAARAWISGSKRASTVNPRRGERRREFNRRGRKL